MEYQDDLPPETPASLRRFFREGLVDVADLVCRRVNESVKTE